MTAMHPWIRTVAIFALAWWLPSEHAAGQGPVPTPMPENLYRGTLVSYPGPWSFEIPKSSIILVSDEQLDALADCDRKVNISLSSTPQEESLRQICERARAAGQRTLILAFDQFFAQYRPGQGDKPRQLTPDKPEYVQRIAAISTFAQQYGLGLELSLLSPLEIGPAYTWETGECGVWMHYRKGIRDPKSGAYSVQLWRQRKWTNNKGSIRVEDAGVRVFAFREHRIGGGPYRLVDPDRIVEISDTAKVEVWNDSVQPGGCVRIRVHGEGGPAPAGGLDRVLVVQVYHTPEMDYFSDQARPYLRRLVDRYADAGVKLNGLYADEMHIQQDWGYHNHHDNGEFALRYVTPGLGRKFAALYGRQYEDFAKYLVYFTHGQEDTASDLSAKEDVMHVFDATPEGIRAAALMRARYYRLLQDAVVDLFVWAKRHAENRMGHRLEARAHATWAESPTCDRWTASHAYEYTSDFVWSNTVQQAASACHDYFQWGDFLTGNGNDHAEGGFLDRNYLGLALASSTGILNEIPYSYAAHWGMPAEIARRRQALVNASGAAAWIPFGMVEGMEHRDVDVLMLYPINLVAVNERFGSWMSQYGYANLVTPAKLVEGGRVVDGAIQLAGRRFRTLVALFEPFPPGELLPMMRQLAEAGGRVIWSGPPPVLGENGKPVLSEWQELAGATYTPTQDEGCMVPGTRIVFEGTLAKVPPMTVLTDFIVDRAYPLGPRPGTEPVARLKNWVVGLHRETQKGGSVTVLGFRPRDDQSGSLGYDARYWFDILDAVGAYPPTGRFAGVNDNTEYLSRTGSFLACRFPNGAVAVAPHLRDLEECWPGGFQRKPEEDRAILKNLRLPSEHIALKDFRVNGRRVSYQGEQAMAFRVDTDGRLLAFAGAGCREITVDGKTTTFADQPMGLVSWAPVEAARQVDGGAVLQMLIHGSGTVRIPAAGLPSGVELVLEGPTPGSRGRTIPASVENGILVFNAGPETNRWLYVVPPPASK